MSCVLKSVCVSSMAIVISLASFGIAQEVANPRPKNSPETQMIEGFLKQLAPAELDEAMQIEVRKKFTEAVSKIIAEREKVGFPKDFNKRRSEIQKVGREEGIKPAAMRKYLVQKLELTEEQAACLKETDMLLAKAKVEIGKMLSEEQIAKLESPFKNSLLPPKNEKSKTKSEN